MSSLAFVMTNFSQQNVLTVAPGATQTALVDFPNVTVNVGLWGHPDNQTVTFPSSGLYWVQYSLPIVISKSGGNPPPGEQINCRFELLRSGSVVRDFSNVMVTNFTNDDETFVFQRAGILNVNVGNQVQIQLTVTSSANPVNTVNQTWITIASTETISSFHAFSVLV